MQILRSILGLLRRPSIATSLAPMHRLSSPSRPLLSFMASNTPRCWPPALARRVFPLMAAPNPPVRRVSRFSHGLRNMATISRVKGDVSGKGYRVLPISSASVGIIPQGSERSAITQGMKDIETDNSKETKNTEMRGTVSEVLDEDKRSDDKDACRTTTEVLDGKHDLWGQNVSLTGCEDDQRSVTKDHTAEIAGSKDEEVSDDEGYIVNNILPKSRHRDGSIYRGLDLWWKKEYYISNRNETRLEAMMLSDPTDCSIRNGFCRKHYSIRMLQFFSLELAEIRVDGGLVELYGYIAVRDCLDPLLNYIVNFSRDDPIIVEQGSLINMAGPKRGIVLLDTTLIEYDMRIKTGKLEKDDLPLIDGVSIIGTEGTWNRPYTMRIPGDCGVIGITLSRINAAVEATVEVLISEVQRSFSLYLGCLTSGLDEEIRLFDGAITESCGLKRSVVAVSRHSLIDLKFEVGTQSSTSDTYRCFFKTKKHGHDIQNIKTYLALISVKVTWSTLPDYFPWPRD